MTRLKLAARRRRRPANAGKSVSWPRKKRLSRTCQRRRKLQKSESKLKVQIGFPLFLLINLDKRHIVLWFFYVCLMSTVFLVLKMTQGTIQEHCWSYQSWSVVQAHHTKAVTSSTSGETCIMEIQESCKALMLHVGVGVLNSPTGGSTVSKVSHNTRCLH